MKHRTPKPAGSLWTDEQWSAITEKGKNVLVAAAAGSGKTAVLVERIIRMITDPEHPCDVDRLLVVTFTKAAAAEMKQRIRYALEQQLDKNPHGAHLRRQLALIHRASVMTLHSFCMEVIRTHYQKLELDPSLRIADDTEMALLKQDTIEEMMEDYYAGSSEGSPFWQLIDSYSGQRSDDAVIDLILKLHDYSRSQPFPEAWLRQSAAAFANHDTAQTDSSAQKLAAWFASLIEDAAMALESAAALLQRACDEAALPQGPAPYLINLQAELAGVNEMLTAAGNHRWDELYELMQHFAFGRLKPCKGDDIDPLLQEQVKAMREEAKKRVQALKEQLFQRSTETFIAELADMAPLMDILVEMTIDFDRRLHTVKRERALLDFSDLEHECLRILLDSASHMQDVRPSEVALAYQEFFEEVLVDEYQDTNLVQETILHLISKPEPGNRFMVGDVKQSIYRFRLAEPRLFLEKYNTYRDSGAGEGMKIDLARNFRSRGAVVDAVNFIFRKIMNARCFEISYDRQAELVRGAHYPESNPEQPARLLIIDRGSDDPAVQHAAEAADTDFAQAGDEESAQLDTAQLEARAIIMQIKQLTGETGGNPALITDKNGALRPVTYRDIVILLRATQQWAPVMMEEFKGAGLPCYAEFNTGYFEAGEIEIMLSLLRVIDNPYQDIPLAAVLRSPLVGLNAEQLAQIRLKRRGSFFEAVMHMAETTSESAEGTNVDDNIVLALRDKLRVFLEQLSRWRTAARRESLTALLAMIYKETHYVDIVGGMPGGSQRQANLRALYDRAKQYESTSLRGLFRFLRFIDRMKERGSDLGTARALGEQENVIRIMSIHKSKGLEFPVVFVAGMGKMFNRQDLNQSFLVDRELGFGPKLVDLNHRISYPSLPYLAIQKKMQRELLAEEMRVLYVALTRAKEMLYLVASTRHLEKQMAKWESYAADHTHALPNALLTNAQSLFDWVGPAVFHSSAQQLFEVQILPKDWDGFAQAAAAYEAADPRIVQAIKAQRPVPADAEADYAVEERLSWRYPYMNAAHYLSKVSVSELKRIHEQAALTEQEEMPEAGQLSDMTDGQLGALTWKKDLLQRPRFLSEKQMTAAERGTAYHAVMQHMPLDRLVDEESLAHILDDMELKAMLTPEQRQAIEPRIILQFFESPVGQALLVSKWKKRELPFSFGLKASEVYPDAAGTPAADEIIVMQGVVDCIFESEEGLVLLDYKTNAVYGNALERIKKNYQMQIQLYRKALTHTLQRPVVRSYLFLFDGAHLIEMT